MAQNFTTQQQITALHKSIEQEESAYIKALEEGQCNSYLQAITGKLIKLMIILECVYNIHMKKDKIIILKRIEFADKYTHKAEPENLVRETS